MPCDFFENVIPNAYNVKVEQEINSKKVQNVESDLTETNSSEFSAIR